MTQKHSFFKTTLALTGLLFISLTAVKCKDDCEDVVCAPCPSSRFLVKYVDNAGNCDPAFYANAKIIGLNVNTWDTVYTYGLSSDSCVAGFLVQEDLVYHVVSTSPAFRDTVKISDWEFQSGIEVKECCMCYPVEHADVWFGGDSTHVEWSDSSFENNPVIRPIN